MVVVPTSGAAKADFPSPTCHIHTDSHPETMAEWPKASCAHACDDVAAHARTAPVLVCRQSSPSKTGTSKIGVCDHE